MTWQKKDEVKNRREGTTRQRVIKRLHLGVFFYKGTIQRNKRQGGNTEKGPTSKGGTMGGHGGVNKRNVHTKVGGGRRRAEKSQAEKRKGGPDKWALPQGE